MRQYYQGGGRGVSVRETGNLGRIVARYMDLVEESLKVQIANVARETLNGVFSDDFYNTYDMTSLVFSIGDTTIGGAFSGRATDRNGIISITGELEFYINNEFADPLDAGVEAIDIEETIVENLLRPIEDHGRARLGLLPSRPQRLGIHTGEPYTMTDTWSGRFEGRIRLNQRESIYRSKQDD